MKPGARTVSVVAVAGTLFALRFLFLFRPSSEQQFLGGISSRIVGDNSGAPVASIPEQARLVDNSDAPVASIPELVDNSYAPKASIPEQPRLGDNSDAPVASIPEQARLVDNSYAPKASIPEQARLVDNSYSPKASIPEQPRLGDNSDAPVASIPEQGTAPELTADEATTDDGAEASSGSDKAALEAMLASAATPDKTVIITTLNQAWATKGTMIDLFLESFHKGENTQFLLKHLVIVALDQRSFERCRKLHGHCFMLKTAGVDFSGSKEYMSKDYLKMMWRRMSLLLGILQMGYNFVFTDADILWFRNPFDHFANNTDFQISCDTNKGNAWSLRNKPNCGFQYARSNERTIAMYRHWCRGGDDNPDIDEQSLLNLMLNNKELTTYKVEIRFLPTERFSGFCQKSKNMSRVVTMHANCCIGLDNKVRDLRRALNDWEAGKSLPPGTKTSKIKLWHVPFACRHSFHQQQN